MLKEIPSHCAFVLVTLRRTPISLCIRISYTGKNPHRTHASEFFVQIRSRISLCMGIMILTRFHRRLLSGEDEHRKENKAYGRITDSQAHHLEDVRDAITRMKQISDVSDVTHHEVSRDWERVLKRRIQFKCLSSSLEFDDDFSTRMSCEKNSTTSALGKMIRSISLPDLSKCSFDSVG